MAQYNNDLGRMLKQRRRMAELTLSQLSAESGVSMSYIGRIENGERYPSATILRKIACPLSITENELFTLAGYLSPKPTAGIESLDSQQLDPYVVSALSQEPYEVQRTMLTIMLLLRTMAKSTSSKENVNQKGQQ
ncbi:helix-turn-helix domain-containing protein [Chloroflexota bacterium]